MTQPERIAEDLYYQQVEETIGQFNNNGKPTVVMFCDAYFPCVDGVVKVVDNLAKRLAKKCNVIVVVPKDRGKTVRSNDYLVIGVKSIYLKKFNYDSAVPAFDGKLKGILSKIRVDVIHVHSPFLLARTAVWLKKRTGAPMIATFHSQYKKDVFRARIQIIRRSMDYARGKRKYARRVRLQGQSEVDAQRHRLYISFRRGR